MSIAVATAPECLSSPMIRESYNPEDIPVIELGNTDPADLAKIVFDPKVHLTFNPNFPAKSIYVSDLGIDPANTISPIGATLPFELFSQEAVDVMRWEISRPEVFSKYAVASNISKCQVRGYARDCPFTYAAWTHPDTVAAVSHHAGIPLEVVFDYEIAHVNFSVENKDLKSDANSMPVVGWHRDSYPFVCVLMLSDTSDMIGGQTTLKNVAGENIHVEDPKRGYGTVLQGRYIEHIALKPQGGKERITMVTSYRPKSSFVKDESVLNTVRAISDLNELYTDWVEYRMARLEDQMRALKESVRQERSDGKTFDLPGVVDKLMKSEAYLADTYKQMCEAVPIKH